MCGQNGIHHKNIEVRGMIGNNQVRTFRQSHSSQAVDPDSAADSNRTAPDYINRKTVFLPGMARKSQTNKGVKEQKRCNEDQPDMQLIN